MAPLWTNRLKTRTTQVGWNYVTGPDHPQISFLVRPPKGHSIFTRCKWIPDLRQMYTYWEETSYKLSLGFNWDWFFCLFCFPNDIIIPTNLNFDHIQHNGAIGSRCPARKLYYYSITTGSTLKHPINKSASQMVFWIGSRLTFYTYVKPGVLIGYGAHLAT